MRNELIINSTQSGCRIALLRDGGLLEYHTDSEGSEFKVGDIYLGTVKKVVQGLNAAFIDIGYEKDAFLHYHDLGPQYNSLNKFVKLVLAKKKISYRLAGFKGEPDIDKFGKITQVLSKGKKILVQVVKEPISTKGPRLSSELSIAGMYMVLVPFSNTVNISKRVSSPEERKRLLRLINSIKPENFGVIIRTVAEGKDVATLDSELRNLVKIWEDGIKKLRHANPRDKVVGEMSRTSSILRDLMNETFDSVIVDDKEIAEETRNYLAQIAPEKVKIVKEHTGKVKVFEQYGIEKQIKLMFGRSVSLKHGGYLIIEHTEAMHVVDVNSGNKSNKESDQEKTALTVNLDSCDEVARQLRLRDMGGIIVIDFIDMYKAENKKAVYQRMRDAMKEDRSKSTVLPLSKFGVMQITRQRVRPEMNIATKEQCPSCGGSGEIAPSILVTDKIEADLGFLAKKQNEKKVALVLHPFIHAYLDIGFNSIKRQWKRKFGIKIELIADSSMGIVDYYFVNEAGEKIELSQE